MIAEICKGRGRIKIRQGFVHFLADASSSSHLLMRHAACGAIREIAVLIAH
jgi:hypothetical protein